MKIGIIGTGNMGRSLGIAWARAGHSVLFGSRDIAKAKSVAAAAGNAHAGDFDSAAEFGDVVLHTVRDVYPSRLLRRPSALDGKVIIDCNNSDMPGFNAMSEQRAPFRFVAPVPSIAERLAKDVPKARVVKAFNTIPSPVIELDRDWLASQQVSVFLCANDAAAKETVTRLVEDLGFTPVDSGDLTLAPLIEVAADFLRFHILGMGRGQFATLSLKMLAPK